MKLKFKKLVSSAKTPAYANAGDACFDLCVLFDHGPCKPEAWTGDDTSPLSAVRFEGNQVPIYKGESLVFHTGLAFEVPEGHVMLVFIRSSAGIREKLALTNGTGVIDSGYRGELHLALTNIGKQTYYLTNGQRVAQAMVVPYPQCELERVDELATSERGANGIGSSGK